MDYVLFVEVRQASQNLPQKLFYLECRAHDPLRSWFLEKLLQRPTGHILHHDSELKSPGHFCIFGFVEAKVLDNVLIVDRLDHFKLLFELYKGFFRAGGVLRAELVGLECDDLVDFFQLH